MDENKKKDPGQPKLPGFSTSWPINERLRTLEVCRNLQVIDIAQDPDRTHGANWVPYGLRRSGHDHDEVACGETILAFMEELQGQYDI